MKRVTIRDIRLHWPQVEKRLRANATLLVTRDGQPVATLSPPSISEPNQRSFHAATHLSWLRKTWAGKHRLPSSDAMLSEERGE